MNKSNLLIFLASTLLILNSCTNEKEQIINDEQLLKAYKEQLKIKPEILSIEIDSVVTKSQVINLYDTIIDIEKEKQIIENRNKAKLLEESLATGRHWYWDRDLNEEERKEWPEHLKEHKSIISNVLSGGDKLDSVKTIRRANIFMNSLANDTASFQIALITVEQRQSEKSGIKYDRWLSIKSNQSGKYEEALAPVTIEGSSEKVLQKVIYGMVDFDPDKAYRKKGSGLFGY